MEEIGPLYEGKSVGYNGGIEVSLSSRCGYPLLHINIPVDGYGIYNTLSLGLCPFDALSIYLVEQSDKLEQPEYRIVGTAGPGVVNGNTPEIFDRITKVIFKAKPEIFQAIRYFRDYFID